MQLRSLALGSAALKLYKLLGSGERQNHFEMKENKNKTTQYYVLLFVV